jgi:LicD family
LAEAQGLALCHPFPTGQAAPTLREGTPLPPVVRTKRLRQIPPLTVRGFFGRSRRSGCTKSTEACDFRSWGEGHVRPECCTSHLLELTSFCHELLARHGITHWLDFGALLGAVRDERFIPWDIDVDFGILARDRDSVLALCPEVHNAGFVCVDRGDPGLIRFNYSPTNLRHLDIFVWAESDGVLVPTCETRLDSPGMHGREAFPSSFVTQLEEVRLYGRSFPAPSPVGRFLAEHRYGPDYLTPVRHGWDGALYPPIGPEQLTPTVERLLERLMASETRLAQLKKRSRLSESRHWRRIVDAGRPDATDPRFSIAVAASVPPREWTSTVSALVNSIASVEQAIDELQRSNIATWLVRNRRRVMRATARVRSRGDQPVASRAADDRPSGSR